MKTQLSIHAVKSAVEAASANGNHDQLESETPQSRLTSKTFYWVIVYEASIAMFRSPLTFAVAADVYPMPRYLLGFPTFDEAKDIETFMLTAPNPDVCERLEGLRQRIRDGEIIHIEPARVMEVK